MFLSVKPLLNLPKHEHEILLGYLALQQNALPTVAQLSLQEIGDLPNCLRRKSIPQRHQSHWFFVYCLQQLPLRLWSHPLYQLVLLLNLLDSGRFAHMEHLLFHLLLYIMRHLVIVHQPIDYG